jgi:8-oxo-dGTP diphosphatase
MTEPVRVVAGAILRDGLLLVGQRPAGHKLSLLWEFPGGKVDPGETDAEALRRELEEELEVVVEVESPFGETSLDGHTGPIHIVAYVCRILTGEPRAVEHSELRWVTTDEFGALPWAPADRVLMELLARHVEQFPTP